MLWRFFWHSELSPGCQLQMARSPSLMGEIRCIPTTLSRFPLQARKIRPHRTRNTDHFENPRLYPHIHATQLQRAKKNPMARALLLCPFQFPHLKIMPSLMSINLEHAFLASGHNTPYKTALHMWRCMPMDFAMSVVFIRPKKYL